MTDPRRITAFLLLCLACVLPLQGQDRITVGSDLPGDGPPPTTYGGMLKSVPAPQITVGSKNFNEGYLLGEIVAQVLELEGFAVERKFGLGGTLVTWNIPAPWRKPS